MASNENLNEKDLNNISGGWTLEGKYDRDTGKNTIKFEYNDEETEYIPGRPLRSALGINTPSSIRNAGDVVPKRKKTPLVNIETGIKNGAGDEDDYSSILA